MSDIIIKNDTGFSCYSKEYQQTYRKMRSEYYKQYYKEYMANYNKIKVKCEICDKEVRKSGMGEHKKTKKHLENVKTYLKEKNNIV